MLEKTNSCLVTELRKLKESSKEAVETLNSFSSFKEFLHVTRQVQSELLSLLERTANSTNSQLVLVCGGVGDGKSHLISYLNQKYPVLMGQFIKHNDATESFEPNKTSIDTLNDVLDAFSDTNLNEKNNVTKIILAINLGALNNFIDSPKYQNRFTKLKKYVYEKKILETSVVDNNFDMNQQFQFINFSDYHMFSINDSGPKSPYISELIFKITHSHENNLIYNSYNSNCFSCISNEKCPVKANFEFFMNNKIIDQITQLLIEAIIKQKIIISTRSLLNFIFDIIVSNRLNNVPANMFKEEVAKLSFIDYINSLTPNILFEQRDLSNILDSLRLLDPIHNRKEEIDRIIIQLNTINNISQVFQEHLANTYPDYFKKVVESPELLSGELTKTKYLKQTLTRTFLRMYLFQPKLSWLDLSDHIYIEYMQNLYWWNKGEKAKLKPLFDRLKDSIYKWNGESAPENVNLFIGRNQLQYKISQRLSLSRSLNEFPQVLHGELHKFIPYLILNFKSLNETPYYSIAIDFSLYSLLMKTRNGYSPNKKDKNNFINFVEFMDKVLELGNQKQELIIQDRLGKGHKFKLSYDADFEHYSFEEI